MPTSARVPEYTWRGCTPFRRAGQSESSVVGKRLTGAVDRTSNSCNGGWCLKVAPTKGVLHELHRACSYAACSIGLGEPHRREERRTNGSDLRSEERRVGK